MVKLEFSGWKLIAELGAYLGICPFAIALKLAMFNYFKVGDGPAEFFLSLLFYALSWGFLRKWAEFYRWTQEHDWSS